MREIIDILDSILLTEATGLAGRKPGDPFKSASGNIVTFNDISFYPEGGGKYTPEELDQALEQVEQQLDIQWQNTRSSKTGGFGLASVSGDGQTYTIGRYFDSIKADPTKNYIDNKFTISGELYSFASKVAQKEQSGLGPLDLLTDRQNQTIPSIMNQLAKSLGTSNPLYAVAHNIAMGSPLPISFPAPQGISFSGFRDYFCEILQPMALQKGQFTGNAMDAADKFLDGTFEGTLINYGETKTGGLTDSTIETKDGKKLLVSSKGGKGAEASSKNLLDEVDKLRGSDSGKKLLKKFSTEVKILEDIVAAGMHGAPLKLGVDLGMIDPSEAKQVQDLRNLPKINMSQVKGLKLSNNLKKIANERTTDNPENVNLYYHLMAAIAHKVAEEINTSTNFSKAAATILNNGALVQVYTKATDSGGKWTLKEFETVYPGDAIKGVFLSAGKGYYSTDIKGNFTFKIDKGSGVPKEKETATTQPVKTPSKDLSKAAAQIAGDAVAPEKTPGTTGVGRTKRR